MGGKGLDGFMGTIFGFRLGLKFIKTSDLKK